MNAATGMLALGLLCAAAPALADDIDYARSQLTFTFRQMNVPADGGFGQFRARIAFDAARPERSRAELEVELASIDTGSRDGDTEVRRRAWFDTANNPLAKFVSTRVRRLGPDRYEVTGQMTIKGRSHELAVPVAVRREDGARVYEGAFPLRRLAFAIGEGVWADTDTVADEVQVRFRVVQSDAPAGK